MTGNLDMNGKKIIYLVDTIFEGGDAINCQVFQ